MSFLDLVKQACSFNPLKIESFYQYYKQFIIEIKKELKTNPDPEIEKDYNDVLDALNFLKKEREKS